MNTRTTILAILSIPFPLSAVTVTLVDNRTPAYYNGSIGTVLSGTSDAFPVIGGSNDPDLDFTTAPDLSPAEVSLGGWLQTPPVLPPQYWTPVPTVVPVQWPVESETAIVYAIDVPASGYTNIVMRFGVDNGLFVWVDGQFVGGALRLGPAVAGEHTYTLPALNPGTHYIQVLREDHGDTNDYIVEITGEAQTADVPAAIATAVEINWSSTEGALYQVQATDSLIEVQWMNFGDPVRGTGGVLSVFDQTRSRQKRFYRVVQIQ